MPRGRKSSVAPENKPIEQYTHTDKDRVNIPPVGLVTPDTDQDAGKQKYAYDPHLDPQLQWAGKAERTSFEVPTVSLHVHERIDPRTIIEAVRKKEEELQPSLFEKAELPLRQQVEFYKHRQNWTNRLIAGDSTLVMNSLLVKEGMAGGVQMIYFDPPYGIKYGSNFQPFVNKRDVKDGKDEDLTNEPETLKAFRDTWELGIHSYLTYLRDRLLLARELLSESGSVFVQISDENVHLVRNLMDEAFGANNFCAVIEFTKTSSQTRTLLPVTSDFLLWYARNIEQVKFRRLYEKKRIGDEGATEYVNVELADGEIRRITFEELMHPSTLPKGAKVFATDSIVSEGFTPEGSQDIELEHEGKKFVLKCGSKRHWKVGVEGIKRLWSIGRLVRREGLRIYKRNFDDFPYAPFTTIWTDTRGETDMSYVVQTSRKVIERCILMTTDPSDIVFDPTCGSGTTAYVAEQWGRRWITCDTSRVSTTLAKQRLMTANFDYYELAKPQEGVASGFRYKTVPHVTLKSIANNEPPATETLYDKPLIDNSKSRVTSPFTVEAVPAPTVQSLVDSEQWTGDRESHDQSLTTNHFALSTAHSGETVRQSELRDELLKTGIRGRAGEKLMFSRVEPLSGTRFLHADAEIVFSGQWAVDSERAVGGEKTKGSLAEQPATNNQPLSTNHQPLSTTARAVISFSPEHHPLGQVQVARALEEANHLFPKPKFVIFAAFQFDPEAAQDIEETVWSGVTLLKAQMNTDLQTEDLKKKRSSNESFWLIGQPDVRVFSGQWLVDSQGEVIANYERYQKLSGLGGLAEINAVGQKDLLFYATLSERRDLWLDLATAAGLRFHSGEHRGRTSTDDHRGIQTIFGNRQRLDGGDRDLDNAVREFESADKGRFRQFIEGLRGNHEVTQRLTAVTQNLKTIHYPLTTKHFHQVEVLGFDYYDYYDTKEGKIISGSADRIAVWMLDTDYDGRSIFPHQVFFPMAGDKEGWARLAKNLKAQIDEELIEAYRGKVSLPFIAGENKRAAVKIVDDRGIESIKLIDLP